MSCKVRYILNRHTLDLPYAQDDVNGAASADCEVIVIFVVAILDI